MTHNQLLQEVLQQASWMQLWRPDLMIYVFVLAFAYYYIMGPLRSRFAESEPVEMKQVFYFMLGLLILYVAKGSPLYYLGHHYLFSAHMLSMALVYMIMVPLLLAGIPHWVVKPLLKNPKTNRVLVFLTHPLISLLIFNVSFSFYHLPAVFDYLMLHPSVHFIYFVVLLTGSFLLWLPLFSIMPNHHPLSEFKKIGYIFGNSVLITPVCALIIFATHPMYQTYMNAPQLFALLPTLDDQQLGGVLMKVIQELSFITAITIIFFAWARKEREKETNTEQSMEPSQQYLEQQAAMNSVASSHKLSRSTNAPTS